MPIFFTFCRASKCRTLSKDVPCVKSGTGLNTNNIGERDRIMKCIKLILRLVEMSKKRE